MSNTIDLEKDLAEVETEHLDLEDIFAKALKEREEERIAKVKKLYRDFFEGNTPFIMLSEVESRAKAIMDGLFISEIK